MTQGSSGQQRRSQQQLQLKSVIMARMADKLLVESDKKRVREYVKKVLFPKTIFVFNQKALDADDRLQP